MRETVVKINSLTYLIANIYLTSQASSLDSGYSVIAPPFLSYCLETTTATSFK